MGEGLVEVEVEVEGLVEEEEWWRREGEAGRPLMEREGRARVRVWVMYYYFKFQLATSIEHGREGTHFLHQLLDLRPKRVFLVLWRGRGREVDVEFLLCGVVDIGEEVGEVLGGLKVDFAVVGFHCLLGASGRGRKGAGL